MVDTGPILAMIAVVLAPRRFILIDTRYEGITVLRMAHQEAVGVDAERQPGEPTGAGEREMDQTAAAANDIA